MIPARRPPPLKVNDWLVSKRFFLDAARTWFSAQTFDRRTQGGANLESVLPAWGRTAQRSEHQAFSMTPSVVMLSHETGLFYTYATSVDVPAAMIPQVLKCRSLKCLRIELRPEDFDLDPRYGWKDVLTETELKGIRRRTRLNALPACKKLDVYCPEGSGVKWQFEATKHQKEVLQSNVRFLQALVQQKTAGKAGFSGSTRAFGPQPLFMHSRVSTRSSVSFFAIHPIRAVCAWLAFMVAMFGLLIIVDAGLDKLSGMPATRLAPNSTKAAQYLIKLR
nr:hypothetical protein B0A51_13427 [Rachicladosporium sp. CCFEE 5018]